MGTMVTMGMGMMGMGMMGMGMTGTTSYGKQHCVHICCSKTCIFENLCKIIIAREW